MGFFITFEGPEGSGKTTHAERLAAFLRDRDREVTLTREPGGTGLGEQIRRLLLDPSYEPVHSRAELLLYLAARAQHVEECIRPALESDRVVISDRFADASVVYQGWARDLGVEWVQELNQWATDDLVPDLTFIMDVPLEEGLSGARAGSREEWDTPEGDRMEREPAEFHRLVREGYQTLAEQNPERCVQLARDRSIEDLQNRIRELVVERMEDHANQSPLQ